MREIFEWLDSCDSWQLAMFAGGILVVYLLFCVGIAHLLGFDDEDNKRNG